MDNTTLSMQVVQPKQNLFGNLLDKNFGDALVVVSLNKSQEIFTENLKDHAHMRAIGAIVSEGVKQTHNICATRVIRVGGDDTLKQTDFI